MLFSRRSEILRDIQTMRAIKPTRRVGKLQRFTEPIGIGFFLVCISIVAQPVPDLKSVSPSWLTRGSNVVLRLTGDNLSAVTKIVFSGDAGLNGGLTPPAKAGITIETGEGGISAAEPGSDKELVVSVSVEPRASLRPRELRVVSPFGVSNPLTLNVSPLPEIAQATLNTSMATAQWLQLPVSVNGTIQSLAETDYYRFHAKSGQKIVIDVYAFRMASLLDSSLALLDSSGREVARNEDYNGLDSFIAYQAPAEGDYYIQLRDFRYQGGTDYRYRLLVGALPYVTSVFPMGGARGQEVALNLQGDNLGSAEKVTLHVDAQAPLGRQEIRIDTPLGVSNPILFDVGEAPEFAEKEPNNNTNRANVVSIPVSINGRLDQGNDVDYYRFKSTREQRLIFEVEARRFGSPLDSLLTLTDAEGKVLAQNDDAVGADSRIDFDKFKKDKEYFVSVRDVLNHGGSAYGYRLTIRQPQPDFAVRCLSDTPRIRRGGREVLRCELTPENGFKQTVCVAFSELPPGVYCQPLLLSPATPASGLLALSAADDAALGSFPIRLSAAATVGGRSVVHAVEPLANGRPVKQAFLTVLEAAPFTLEAEDLDVVVEQNQTATVAVMAQRRPTFTGDIKISAEGFSAGKEPLSRSLEAKELILKGHESQGTVKLKAQLGSEVGTRTIVLRGEATVDGYPVVAYSAPVPVTLHQFPFVLNPTLRRLSVTALPLSIHSAAREAAVTVKLERRMGFKQEVLLTLDGVPEGITATVEKIPADGDEANIKLVASDKAPVGKEFTLTVSGAGTFNDRTYRQKAPPITLNVAAPTDMGQTVAVHTQSASK